jgi:hypothetical protein
MLWAAVAAATWLHFAPAPGEELLPVRQFGRFTDAQAMAVDPSGTVYVVEGRDRQILKVSPSGSVLAKWGGYAWTGEGAERLPDIAAPNGIDVYAADYGNHRVLRFDRNLNLVSTLPGAVEGEENRRFGFVRSVTVSRLGVLFAVDGENDRVVQIEANEVRRVIGGLDAGAGRLQKPRRVRIGAHDDIYVVEERGIVRYDMYGTLLALQPRPGLLAIAAADTAILLLDSCSVSRWDGRGAPVRLDGDLCGNGAAVDVAVFGDSVYILTSSAIRVYARGIY